LSFLINPYRYEAAIEIYYDKDISLATSAGSVDHDFDGFRNVNHTGSVCGYVKMWLYRIGTPLDITINLYHYESSTLTNTFAPGGGEKYTDLTTSSSGQAVIWTFSTSVTLTANTSFVIENSKVSGSDIVKAKLFYETGFDFETVKGTGSPPVFAPLGGSWCGLITSPP